MERAACAGQAPVRKAGQEYRDEWFPDRGHQYVNAMETCFYCPVRRECKDFRDLIQPEYGVWGGKIQRRGSEVRRSSRDKKAG